QYGDRRILEENYDGLKKYVEFLRSIAPGNVLTFSRYGDWVPIVHTTNAFVSAAYYYDDVNILSQIAGVLGKTADEQTYAQLASAIKDAVNQKFFDPATGNYANGTQTANAMALELGLAPEKLSRRVAANLTNDIVYYHNTHVTTGFIGVKFLMPALVEIGRPDLAYDLATQTTYPSWGYMIKQGATTLWELWQQKTGPSMNSQDHAMFGSVGAWFYRALAGINLAPNGAGYRHIRIEPNVVEDLTSASGTINTIRGIVSSSWSRSAGKIMLDVTIPAGADATVLVPKEEEMTGISLHEGGHAIWEDGHYVEGDPGLTGAALNKNGVEVEIGAGRYSFVLTGE
ncbi:MAG: alpha-L-rhamnosidase C-terminal domain-containing protein, partial [Terriglobia bacterium]